MDTLTAFGTSSASVMVAAYALEARSHWDTLLFALACVASSTYAFLAGSPVFGALELIWYFIAMRRWVARPGAR